MPPPYEVVMSLESLKRITTYKDTLQANRDKAGYYLRQHVDLLSSRGRCLDQLTVEQFLQLILTTKKSTFFGGSEVRGNGADWNDTELEILGDINVAMTVTVFDNGVWNASEEGFKVHRVPFSAQLIFTPGPLLRGDHIFLGQTPDLREVFDENAKTISLEKYTRLIERRLMPGFVFANERATKENKKALIVLPGIGCGWFSGNFLGKMGEFLNRALQTILKENCEKLENIACVRYDPHRQCTDSEETIHHILYRVRRGVGPLGRPQLSTVQDFEENPGEFKNCCLYKIVAWDHTLLPGNVRFEGDNGMTTAATTAMTVLTGVKGKYTNGYYLPAKGIKSWGTVFTKHKTKLLADGNVRVALPEGRLIELSQFGNRFVKL